MANICDIYVCMDDVSPNSSGNSVPKTLPLAVVYLAFRSLGLAPPIAQILFNKYSMSLVSPSSWGLHYTLSFTFTDLCITLLEAFFRDPASTTHGLASSDMQS